MKVIWANTELSRGHLFEEGYFYFSSVSTFRRLFQNGVYSLVEKNSSYLLPNGWFLKEKEYEISMIFGKTAFCRSWPTAVDSLLEYIFVRGQAEIVTENAAINGNGHLKAEAANSTWRELSNSC